MNVKAKVLQTVTTSDGRLLAKIQLNGKLPPEGTTIDVRWGSKRSLPQNALLWTFYSWLINHGGLKEHGHFSEQGLHESLKQHFLSEKIMSKGEFKAVENADDLTTTLMNKSAFSEYMDKVDKFMQEFFNVNTVPFWETHEEMKGAI